ncbi:MAG: hypothetical protein ABSE08_01995 [Syntrophobacteraceae bacterium]|jgi:hypothetical protein
MKKAVVLMFFPLLLMGLVSDCLADGLTLKASGPGKWTAYDSDGQEVATVGREGKEGAEVNEGGYSILPKGGQYLGIVRSDGNLQVAGRHPVISPSDARLYLDVVEAIKTIQ